MYLNKMFLRIATGKGILSCFPRLHLLLILEFLLPLEETEFMRITEEREHCTNMSGRRTRFINVQVDLSKIARLVGALAIEVTKERVKDILSRKWIEEKDGMYFMEDTIQRILYLRHHPVENRTEGIAEGRIQACSMQMHMHRSKIDKYTDICVI